MPQTSTQLPNTTTHFCTTKGWFPRTALTPAVRRAILSAEDGVGFLNGAVITQTANKLIAMGLVEDRRAFGLRLTFHGECLWCEIDD